ncbi:MAG TPA: restriction endonuclease subunit S [Chitinophagaceae bacterium]|nr:restriction endonuclease subunit S [Chitinophagaceae bacterium]
MLQSMTEKINTKPFYNADIPSDWEVRKLGEISEITSGGTPDRKNKNYWNGSIPWITTSQIDFGEIKTADEFITEDGLKNSSAKYFVKGTLLIALYGQGKTRGKVAILGIDATTNQACAGIIPKEELNKNFLFFNLSNRYDEIRNLSNSGSQENLSGTIIKQIKLPLPPLPEQKVIAQLLSTWDDAITKTQALIAQKEQRKKWLMQNLLTGKKRLNGLDNEKWERISAGEIFKNVSVKGFDNEKLLSATQNKGIIPRSMLEARVTMPAGETTSFKLVEIGDFVISLRSFQGGLEYSYYRGIVSPAYTVLKPIKKVNDEFYKSYFKSYDFIGHLAVAVIGIRDGKQVSYEDFCFVKIPYPSIEEQNAIAQMLQSTDREIQLLRTKMEKLKEQKKGLMQVLLTGKKRLKI